MAAPNQRIIYIERVSDQVRKEFFKIGHEQLNKAASDLSGNAFKLYIYLCDNQADYRLELSSKHFISWSGTSESTYDRAFKELKEKQYLMVMQPAYTCPEIPTLLSQALVRCPLLLANAPLLTITSLY